MTEQINADLEINYELQKKINREALIKNAARKAQIGYSKRQAEARAKINDLKELGRIENEYILDCE